MTVDELLARVHARLNSGIEVLTFANGAVEVTWRRHYGHCGLSDERFTSTRSLIDALEGILRHEDEADAEDRLDEDRCRRCIP